MASGVLQVVVKLQHLSGIPSDVSENVFHFLVDGTDNAGDATLTFANLVPFYNTTGAGGTNPVAAIIGPMVSRAANACSMLAYFTDDLSGATPFGSPVGMSNFTMGTEIGGSGLPAEVAIVNSFHGDLTDIPETEPNPSPPPAIIRPAARLRGRVFIGPLDSTALVDAGASNELVVTSAVRNDIAMASKALRVACNADDIPWCTWSKVGAELSTVEGGFVDNAPDIQRRRGTKSDARTTWAP